LAVLVNARTASTSELLSAALRDSRGGLLIGEPTYGKGLTQRVVPLRGGWTLLVSTFEVSPPVRNGL
jgi:carboxyl-terminal processing protease